MKIEPLPLFDRIKSALLLEPMSRNELVLLLDVPKLPLIEATQILEARGEIRRLGKSKLWVNVPAAKVRASRRLVADTSTALYRAVEAAA
jgi:hypothetical protein